MSPFEYVVVLISIILGLGITQILTGIADLIHQHQRVRFYWPHLLWIVLGLVLHVQEWWITYDLRDFGPWRLPTFLFIMLYPVNLFILARLLFPHITEHGTIDLQEFYHSIHRKVLVMIGILALLAMADNYFIRSLPVSNQLVPALLLGVCTLLIFIRRVPSWVHYAFPICLLITLIITLVVEWNQWLIA